MKKLFLCLIFISFYAFSHGQKPAQHVVPTQSAQAYPFGIGYAYEHPIGWRSTISGMVSIEHISQFGTLLALWDNYTWLFGDFEIRPAVQVQLRNYYNIRRRERMGKNTYMNSGGYFSLIAHYGFHSLGPQGDFNATLSIKPVWGYRYVDNHFLMEFWAGLQLFMVLSDGGADYCPGITAGLKFGYIL